MVTKFIPIEDIEKQRAALEEAAEMIRSGDLVAFPTETVYGLGGNGLNPDAARKIYEAKGRPSDNPLILHIADITEIDPLVAEFPEEARRLAEAFWPGPLTMILPKAERVPYETTGGLETVAIRMPNHPVALELIRRSGCPIAAPSANTSGRPSPTLAEHVREDLDGKIAAILDGGEVGIGIESTIVDLTGEVPMILRPGYYNPEMLGEVLGQVLLDPSLMELSQDAKPKAPGMKYRHYAPKAEITIVKGELTDIIDKINSLISEDFAAGKRVGVLCTEETKDKYRNAECICVGSRAEEEEIARNLFCALRQFDHRDVDVIYAEDLNTPTLGWAVMNRLGKAAAHKELMVSGSRGANMEKYRRILTVSKNDTCIGPMAAALLGRALINDDVCVESRGVRVLFPEPMNEKAEAVLVGNGFRKNEHTARALAEEDFDDETMILALSEEEFQGITEKFDEPKNLFLLAGLLGKELVMPQPYGQELSAYGACFEQLEEWINLLADYLEA